jgi:undecaprenyl-diphosphatase
MIEWLSNLENSILLWINRTASNSTFDSLFPFYTDMHKIKWFIIPAVLLILFFYIKKYKRSGVTYFVFLLLSLSISDFTGKLVKDYFNRPRPFTVAELGVVQKSPAGEGHGFYSNHSSNMFTFATYTSAFFPAAKPFVFGLAILTGYSRMYNGVHYPSDVLAGAIMGMLIGWLMTKLARKVVYKIHLAPLEKKS